MPIDIFGRTGNTNKNAQTRTQIIDLSQFLKHDGTTVMTGNLDMGTKSIKNLPMPKKESEAANKEYVDIKINHLDTILKIFLIE